MVVPISSVGVGFEPLRMFDKVLQPPNTFAAK